jgi:MFS family permease
MSYRESDEDEPAGREPDESTLSASSASIERISVESPPRVDDRPSAPTEAQLESEAKPARFAALRHRNFRLFWAGNLLSNTGTFAQQAAQGWLVRALTVNPNDAPTNLSLVTACGTFPILILTLYAGVVADRVDRRQALLVTNALAACLALFLAVLVYFGMAQVWHVAVIALFTGCVNAFDIPIRQSYNREMVEPDDLPNAIALNSSAFNAARVLGPAVGGVLLRTVGTAGCFAANAFSYFAMLLGLSMQRLPPQHRERKQMRLSDIREGFCFVWTDDILRLVTILVAFVSLMAMSFAPLLPVFARDIFKTNESGFAALMTCNGLGALGSAVSLAVAGQMRHKGKRLLVGAFGFCLSVVCFAASPTLVFGCIWLIVAGWFLLTFLMTANTMIQTMAPDDLRGRVFSVYSLALIGTAPLGALMLGALAKVLGARTAVEFCASIAAAFTFMIFYRYRSLWKAR